MPAPASAPASRTMREMRFKTAGFYVVAPSYLQGFDGSALDPVSTRPGRFPVTAPSAQTSSPLT